MKVLFAESSFTRAHASFKSSKAANSFDKYHSPAEGSVGERQAVIGCDSSQFLMLCIL
jgi:hypothetical protein